jgi:hypothetical protein
MDKDSGLKNEVENWVEFRDATVEIKEIMFGPGEWVDEPDRVEFGYKGVWCQIGRSQSGALCGYIFISQDHPWAIENECEIPCDVHGGCTYSQTYGAIWKVGFDCAHSGDLIPLVEKVVSEKGRRK